MKYRENFSGGGIYVTVRSDAHKIDDIGADNGIAKKLIEDYGVQEVIYEHRKRIVLK